MPLAEPPDSAVLLKLSRPRVASATGDSHKDKLSTGVPVPIHTRREAWRETVVPLSTKGEVDLRKSNATTKEKGGTRKNMESDT